jgi:hypothetical protein
VSWLSQTLDDQGQPAPTEVHQVSVDQGAVDEFGQRRLGLSTQLTTAQDAAQIGDRVMSRSRAVGWRASALTWDTQLPVDFADSDRAAAMTILNGAKRIGLPIVLTELPAWAPADADETPLYLEGGTYVFEGGRWRFELTVSPAGLTGGGLAWRDVDPSFKWNKFDPAIRWVDMYGVGKAA